jgi:hypothetical protein
MRPLPTLAAVASAATLALATPAAAQRTTELGIDAGAYFGLGDQSSIDVSLPGSRFRVGFFQPGSRISIEPAAGLAFNKTEGVDGIISYDLELGMLYHLRPILVTTTEPGAITTRVTSPYVRPFVGFTGFSGGGDASDNEFSIGAGVGTKIPWRSNISFRLEANLGYGFDNEALRLGALAGLSFFPR